MMIKNLNNPLYILIDKFCDEFLMLFSIQFRLLVVASALLVLASALLVLVSALLVLVSALLVLVSACWCLLVLVSAWIIHHYP